MNHVFNLLLEKSRRNTPAVPRLHMHNQNVKGFSLSQHGERSDFNIDPQEQ
jgi:hypothetical protein